VSTNTVVLWISDGVDIDVGEVGPGSFTGALASGDVDDDPPEVALGVDCVAVPELHETTARDADSSTQYLTALCSRRRHADAVAVVTQESRSFEA